MRKIQKRILVTLIALFAFAVSCKDSFLEVAPTASITNAQLTSAAGLEGQLIGVYSMLTGRGADFYAGATNWFWGSVLGGEANKGTNSGDQAQMNEVQAYTLLWPTSRYGRSTGRCTRELRVPMHCSIQSRPLMLLWIPPS